MVKLKFLFTFKASMAISWHACCVLKTREAPMMTNQGEPIEYVIEELIYHGSWRRGDLHLSGALGGTGLAAVAYHAEKKQVVRLYFQAADLSLQEYYSIDGLWSLGRSISPVRFHSCNPNRNFAKALSTLKKRRSKRRLEPPSVLSSPYHPHSYQTPLSLAP